MDPRIQKELEKEEVTDFHKALLKHCVDLVDGSRVVMQKEYEKWDQHNNVYKGLRTPDVQDKKAKERGEPEKMIVPLTYSQVQTFIAFCFSVFFQREKMYELVGMSAEDHRPAKVGEALLQRDLRHNNIEGLMYQFLLDIGRFGLGIIKSSWKVEMQKVTEDVEVPALSILGYGLGAKTVQQEVEKPKYQGNKLVNISPYRFFPDVRMPLSRFQEGEFVACEDEVTFVALKQMEKDGDVAGIDHVKVMTKMNQYTSGQTSRRLFSTDIKETSSAMPWGQTSGTGVLTEVQITLIPKNFMIDGKPMSPEDFPMKWNVWYVNDQRIVKAEPLGYVHDMYTYDVSQFSPDMHTLVSDGLAGTIDKLQEVITWLINSHITSVRKTIQNWIVVDPEGVNMKDISDRSPVIRLKPGAYRSGVDKWLKQLAVTDVTGNHIQDSEFLQGVVQIVTGINDNALGQFHSGRRSATEAKNVNSATASRLITIAKTIWTSGLDTLGKKMLSNLRDGLDMETYVRVIGDSADLSSMAEFKKVSKDALVGDYDFEIFDGTLPSERQYQAETIMDLVNLLISAPQVNMALQFDLRALIMEVLELRNIRDPARFMAQMQSPEQMQQILPMLLNGQQQQPGMGPAGQTGAPQGAPGVPGQPTV